jgi:hypothetical protein
MTTGNRLSGTIRRSQASTHPGAGFRPFGCRHLGEACRPTNNRWHRYFPRGELTESRGGNFDLQGVDIYSSD